MDEKVPDKPASEALMGLLEGLTRKLQELRDSLLAGNPDEILRVAEATCLMVAEIEKDEALGLCVDCTDREGLAGLVAETRKLARLDLIVASCALRANARALAALHGTSGYGRGGERVLEGKTGSLSASG